METEIERKQNITVNVAGNKFSLEIIGSEEPSYREAAEIFEYKIEYYLKKYADKPRNIVLAMAGYDMAVGFLRYINSIDNSEIIRELEEIL